MVRITSAEGTDRKIDIEGLQGERDDGYLWDPDIAEWKSSWQTLPPAVPGIVLPKGRANGVIAVDGFILYEPSYDHETPKTPLLLTIEDSWTPAAVSPHARPAASLARGVGPGSLRVSRPGPCQHWPESASDAHAASGVRDHPWHARVRMGNNANLSAVLRGRDGERSCRPRCIGTVRPFDRRSTSATGASSRMDGSRI